MKLLREIVKARKKSIVFVLVLILVNVVLALFIRVWQEPRITSLQTRWLQQRQLLATGGGDIAGIYRQGRKDLDSFTEMIPVRKSFARVVGELFESAASNGLSVSAVSYKPGSIKEGVLDYSLSFSVAGTYAGVKSYLADLQRVKEMVIVDQVTLNNSKATEEAVDLKLLLTIYLRAAGS